MIYLSEDIWDFDLSKALNEISEQRREQALKFKFEQGQRLCVLAYQLLKEGLHKEYVRQPEAVGADAEHGNRLRDRLGRDPCGLRDGGQRRLAER